MMTNESSNDEHKLEGLYNKVIGYGRKLKL